MPSSETGEKIQSKPPPPGLYPPLGTQNASWTAVLARMRSFSEMSFNPCMERAWLTAVSNTSSAVSPHASKSQSVPKSLHLKSFSMLSLLLPETTGRTRATSFLRPKINHSSSRRQGAERSRSRGPLWWNPSAPLSASEYSSLRYPGIPRGPGDYIRRRPSCAPPNKSDKTHCLILFLHRQRAGPCGPQLQEFSRDE